MTDSCCFMAENNKHCKAINLQLKEKSTLKKKENLHNSSTH